MNRLRARRIARGVVPLDGSLDALVSGVSQRVGHPIVLIGTELADGYSGMWYGYSDYDEIHFPKSAPDITKKAAICHELAHIMLGHRPENSLSLGGDVFKHVDPTKVTALRVMHRSVYDAPIEHDAELLATMLLHRLHAAGANSQTLLQ